MAAATHLQSYKPEFHGTDSPYPLPNDIIEQGRLEEQHECMKELMGGSVLHARPTNPQKIVDIGCGTGVVTRELAAQYPSTQVYGVDLSSMEVHKEKPANLTFIQGDAQQLMGSSAGGDPRLAPGTIDYVYQRFLVCALTDWPTQMRLVADALRPGGGVVEMNEWGWRVFEEDGGVDISHLWPAMDEATRYARDGKGLDFRCSEKLAGWMRDAGLVDVEVKTFHVPISGEDDPAHPEGHRFQRFLAGWQFHALDLIMDGVTLPGDEDYIARLKEQMKREWRAMTATEGRKYFKTVVVTGRKP